MGKEQVEIYVEELMGIRKLLLRVIRQIRGYLAEYNLTEDKGYCILPLEPIDNRIITSI